MFAFMDLENMESYFSLSISTEQKEQYSYPNGLEKEILSNCISLFFTVSQFAFTWSVKHPLPTEKRNRKHMEIYE